MFFIIVDIKDIKDRWGFLRVLREEGFYGFKFWI